MVEVMDKPQAKTRPAGGKRASSKDRAPGLGDLAPLLRCPICRGELRAAPAQLVCADDSCRAVFPVVRGVPVLINEARSAFAISDFTDQRRTTGQELSRGVQLALSILPEI